MTRSSGVLFLACVLQSLMRALNIIHYNPQCANSNLRIDTILNYWHTTDIIALVGTKRRATGSAEASTETRCGFELFHFGWEDKAQQHAGITLAIKSKLLSKARIVQVVSPVQGRVAGLRFKGAQADTLLLAAYPPPYTTKINKDMVKKVWAAVDKTIAATGHRCCPVLLCDANARIGLRRAGNGWEPDNADEVGGFSPEREN
eukprot:TRINITY_DN59487_c0_g2_i1.p1 TRINITY_DN59487_c0_g2~~TRINITY_DN59487_c0_g2_i1.p1  ORF type:complete len:228 (-),score=29.06 TRINITY_DN59487_c0_g2_i1:11-619(-)